MRVWSVIKSQSFHFKLFHAYKFIHIIKLHFSDNFPNIRSIVANSPLIFASVDEFVDMPRPTSPRVVNIGGLGLRNVKLKSLNETPFEIEMQRGRLGVVFFSLGSLVPTTMLPDGFMANILRAFGELVDYHFILRVDKDDKSTVELAHQYTNVYLTTWAPQTEILAHPRLKLFVTHAGYGSLMESVRFAVPIVAMGVFGDQPHNALMVERNGWGRAFRRDDLVRSHKSLALLVREVLEDEKIRENAKRVQKLFLTRPQSAEERLTQHINFLEANDGRFPELIPESVRLNYFVNHNLDIWLIFGLIFAILVWMIVKVLMCFGCFVLKLTQSIDATGKRKRE